MPDVKRDAWAWCIAMVSMATVVPILALKKLLDRRDEKQQRGK